MKCPECDTPGAYCGFSTIECTNEKCVHYVETLKKEVPEVPVKVEANEEEENIPLWLWSNHHHDFGD